MAVARTSRPERPANDKGFAPDYGSTSMNGVGGVFLPGIGAIALGLPITALPLLLHPLLPRTSTHDR
jgi:hypothetical protein